MATPVTRILNWYDWETGTVVVSFLKWKPTAPLIIEIEFQTPPENTLWCISRDLMADVAEGKTTSAGIGDIQISSVPRGTWVHDGMAILLRSPHGTGKLRTDMSKVQFFLKAIEAQVPRGTEEIDIDSVLTRLLEGNYE